MSSREGIPWSRPLFRWAGSKRSILPLLLNCVPNSYRRYVEPFAGSACLFFALKPPCATLGDFNADLMHAYGVIAQHPRLIARGIKSQPVRSKHYYAIRALKPDTLDDVSRAIRFAYLNRYCFNGVYRTNRKNEFNVPRGSHLARVPSEAEIVRCAIALRGADLSVGDFETTLQKASSKDFVYLDPPYSTATRPTLGEYGYGSFSEVDDDRLINRVNSLSKAGVQVLLSYAYNRKIIAALRGWSVVSVPVRRQIAGGSKNTSTFEILASNFSDLDRITDSADILCRRTNKSRNS